MSVVARGEEQEKKKNSPSGEELTRPVIVAGLEAETYVKASLKTQSHTAWIVWEPQRMSFLILPPTRTQPYFVRTTGVHTRETHRSCIFSGVQCREKIQVKG